MTIEIHLVKTTHGFLGVITIGNGIAMTGQCLMKKLPGHISQSKRHQEKKGD